MRSDEIDVGFYCSHLAAHLTSEDERFVIYAPVVMNAEIVAYQGQLAQAKTLGIGQQRKYLQNLAQEAYPQFETVEEISLRLLGYSLETGLIDAAVVDSTKASDMPQMNFAKLAKHDYISYVLVVSEDIVDTKAFRQFVDAYNEVIDGLDGQKLQDDIGMDKSFWEESGIKFLPIKIL